MDLTLEQLRGKLDLIDADLCRLIKDRMQCSVMVAEVKKAEQAGIAGEAENAGSAVNDESAGIAGSAGNLGLTDAPGCSKPCDGGFLRLLELGRKVRRPEREAVICESVVRGEPHIFDDAVLAVYRKLISVSRRAQYDEFAHGSGLGDGSFLSSLAGGKLKCGDQGSVQQSAAARQSREDNCSGSEPRKVAAGQEEASPDAACRRLRLRLVFPKSSFMQGDILGAICDRGCIIEEMRVSARTAHDSDCPSERSDGIYASPHSNADRRASKPCVERSDGFYASPHSAGEDEVICELVITGESSMEDLERLLFTLACESASIELIEQ